MAVTLSRDESDVIRCFEATCHPFVTKWGNLSKSEMLSADGPRTGEAWHCLVPEAFVAGSVRACQRNQRWEETKVTMGEKVKEAPHLPEAGKWATPQGTPSFSGLVSIGPVLARYLGLNRGIAATFRCSRSLVTEILPGIHAPKVHCPCMPPTQSTTEKRFFTSWVVASSAGWFGGVIVILMLDVLQDLFRVGNGVYIGVGMGWSIGFAQWRIARKWFGATSRWMWASTVGMTIPFLVADLVGAQWDGDRLYLIPALGAAGGLLAGLLQKSSLRSHSGRTNWWVAASGAAWMCPALLIQLIIFPGHPRTPLEAVRNTGSILLGGVVLGVVTGSALVWLLTPDTRRPDPPITC